MYNPQHKLKPLNLMSSDHVQIKCNDRWMKADGSAWRSSEMTLKMTSTWCNHLSHVILTAIWPACEQTVVNVTAPADFENCTFTADHTLQDWSNKLGYDLTFDRYTLYKCDIYWIQGYDTWVQFLWYFFPSSLSLLLCCDNSWRTHQIVQTYLRWHNSFLSWSPKDLFLVKVLFPLFWLGFSF